MNLLRMFRLEKGYSQDEMARDLDMATSLYNRIERKTYPMSVKTAKKIIAWCANEGISLTLDEILADDNQMDDFKKYEKICVYAANLGVSIEVDDLHKIIK